MSNGSFTPTTCHALVWLLLHSALASHTTHKNIINAYATTVPFVRLWLKKLRFAIAFTTAATVMSIIDIRPSRHEIGNAIDIRSIEAYSALSLHESLSNNCLAFDDIVLFAEGILSGVDFHSVLPKKYFAKLHKISDCFDIEWAMTKNNRSGTIVLLCDASKGFYSLILTAM